jgi:AraC-like DNA-binding protein
MYTTAMNEKAFEKLELENSLRHALERNEFRVYYQPFVDLHSENISGMEALLRWQHPVRGLVGPLEFIPIAEEVGLIGAMGEWVLYEACAQNRRWQKAGFSPLRVAVNVSAMQFQDPKLVKVISSILKETGLDPTLLELELTESISLNKKKKSENKIILPELIIQIENLFDKDKIFMDPEITLDKISKLLNTNRSYLSETINQHYNKSFRTIINTYRINEARLLLVDEKFHHYSIEGIALTVGYKSISSFNSVFKKETGITPSYFRNTYLNMKKQLFN